METGFSFFSVWAEPKSLPSPVTFLKIAACRTDGRRPLNFPGRALKTLCFPNPCVPTLEKSRRMALPENIADDAAHDILQEFVRALT
eukprot:6764100-Pyramimonas_sp.AAC.1